MRDQNRDPYAAAPAPRERGGPMLRFAIVAALLGAAVWAYMAYSQGPGLTEAAREEPTSVADASRTPGYATSAEVPEAAPPPEAASPAQPSAPQPRSTSPAPAPEPVPPPSTTTVPPA